ncbi:MAG: lytic transglycosylase domain-containing protein [Pseudomonadota bacterium]
MQAVRGRDWAAAYSAARRVGPAMVQVVDWHALRAGRGDFDDYLTFLDTHPDWPGLALLRKAGETKITPETRRSDVLDFFGEDIPQTAHGALHLADALRASGDAQSGADTLVLAWTTLAFAPAEEKLFLEEFGPLLRPTVHDRIDMLLWRGRFSDAERLLPFADAGWKELAAARAGLRRDTAGVDGLVNKVPKALADNPGLAYERFLWRLDRGRTEGAIDMIRARSESAAALGQPERWASWRRYLARSELRAGRTEVAYELAANHFLEGGSNFADLEWLAGYIALRLLDQPEAALAHFQTFKSGVKSPISLGRAGYWEGRALETLGRETEAATAFAYGAGYQTSFYGLLAAERAGIPMDPALAGAIAATGWETSSFAGSTVLEAALELHASGELDLAERFFTHLAESLPEDEAAQLGELALELDEPHIAVMIGKRVARRGMVLPRPYFPVVAPARELPVDLELALSIIRRESEFDPKVVSGAGARGLMQLMPRTAQEMAGRLNIGYSQSRLTADPIYNAQLGSAYLAELEDRYSGNIVLMSAAYNAGPSRADRWIAQFGDPRATDVDVIDWIEGIPFRETRNYVMRVAESHLVYRARVSGKVQPIELTEELKSRN